MAWKAQRWLGAALCLLCSLSSHAGSPVWAIQGRHNTVYLAGSVHLLKSADATLPEAFERAYRRSPRLVMELDMDQLSSQDALRWMSAHGQASPGSLRRVLGDAAYQQVRREALRLGVGADALEHEAPWVLGLQLMDLQYAQLGFVPASGVEQQLEQRARKDGKAISGLETLAQQLEVFGTLSYKDQAHFLTLIVNELPRLEQQTQSVVEAWRAGDEERLAALLGQEVETFPRLYHALVTERNLRWLPQIRKLLEEPQDVLVVVGVLHLVGKSGLLELLRHEGHTVRSLAGPATLKHTVLPSVRGATQRRRRAARTRPRPYGMAAVRARLGRARRTRKGPMSRVQPSTSQPTKPSCSLSRNPSAAPCAG